MTVIRVEHLSKQYRLGMIGGATLREDLSRWWALKRGKPDPLAKVGSGDGRAARIGEPFWALRDVSFEVKQGEILGIIGRNGAGKSTLLKILSRITAPTEGVVKVKGRIGSLLEVGTGFHPELTGRENIYLNGAILGMSRREVDRKLDEIVAFSECEQFIDTPVKRYSSGMYVRLAFAVAAHLDPEILIVDEVLAVGDAAFQKKCLGKMGDVSREGRTVLFVSHNMASVQALCRDAIVLDQGLLLLRAMSAEAIGFYMRANASGPPRSGALLRDDGRAGASLIVSNLSVHPIDQHADAPPMIYPGGGLRAQAEIIARRDVEDVSASLEIRDLTGRTMMIANTAMTGQRLRFCAGSRHRVSFILNGIWLRPGTYLAYCTLRQRGGLNLDELQAGSPVQVLVPDGAIDISRHSGPVYGQVEVACERLARS